MRTMQTILTVFCCMCIAAVNFAQVLAGQAGEGFYHVTSSPYFELEDSEYISEVGAPLHTKSLDINGDGIFDLYFTVDYHQAFGGGGGQEPVPFPTWAHRLSLSEGFHVQMDTTSFFAIGLPGSIVNIVAPLEEYYNIEGNNNNLNYQETQNALPLAWNINNASYANGWVGAISKYVGLRQVNGTDTLYGWIRISVPDWYRIVIHEYAFQSENTLDTLIDLNISEAIQETEFTLGPNPFEDKLILSAASSNKIKACSIYSMQGKLEMMVPYPVQEINTANLSSGVYIVVLQFENGVEVRRRMVRG